MMNFLEHLLCMQQQVHELAWLRLENFEALVYTMYVVEMNCWMNCCMLYIQPLLNQYRTRFDIIYLTEHEQVYVHNRSFPNQYYHVTSECWSKAMITV